MQGLMLQSLSCWKAGWLEGSNTRHRACSPDNGVDSCNELLHTETGSFGNRISVCMACLQRSVMTLMRDASRNSSDQTSNLILLWRGSSRLGSHLFWGKLLAPSPWLEAAAAGPEDLASPCIRMMLVNKGFA